jgi:Cu(I)/Ag(I) efflux system membrane fusion protein/cobalt-zinc-cadmium efflux system membrane fusion protein
MRSGKQKVFRLVALAACLLIGVVIGVAGHEPITTAAERIMHGGGLAAAHGDDAAGKQLWTCSMHPQVIRDEPGLCPICHMRLTPLNVAVSQPATAEVSGSTPAGGQKVKYWWDPMTNPPYISDRPGKSPMGMDLIPVYEDQASAGPSIKIDPVIVQNMGVRLAAVTSGPVIRDIRAVGYLDEAQPNVRDVNLRVSGWVEKLYADTVGMALSTGAPLFDLYSPEVQVAVEELIGARKSIDALAANADPSARKTTQSMFNATRLKLEQWGLDPEQVKRLAALDQPPRSVTFASPIDGYLTQKMISQGTAVKAGDTVLRVVDLSTVWLDAQVYTQDLPFVRIGQKVWATVEGAGAKPVEGEIVFVAPQIDPQTRTATVRVALPNMALALRPGMFATAHIHAQLAGNAVLVPREAVIDSGRRQVSFVATGGGHFEPRQVKLGTASAEGMVQVLDGLAVGETVVTSGQFLLDAESRMQEAIQKHLSQRGGVLQPATRSEQAIEHVAHAAGTTPTLTPSVTTQPVAPLAGGTEASDAVDEVLAAYLKIQAVLGATQKSADAVDPLPLAAAARGLQERARGRVKSLGRAIADAAIALKGQSLPEQRKLYKSLSNAVIELADASPPSPAVARGLFVAFCPMAPGDGARWIQPSDQVANPYFATSMKECGTIERSIAIRPATGPSTLPGGGADGGGSDGGVTLPQGGPHHRATDQKGGVR